jgi:inosine-uridine nucleoside N-ribohydrolase
MTKRLLIDCSPGIDDALALSLLLFSKECEVAGVTAVEGAISAHQATSNVQSFLSVLDPPRLPRVGKAAPMSTATSLDMTALLGRDGLGNLNLPETPLHHEHPSEKMILDESRAAQDGLVVLALGPLTNVASALQRDPSMVQRLGRLIIAGGSVHAAGDVTPAAEMNIYHDPVAARSVFRSAASKTLVPLEIARRVPIFLDILDCLPPESSPRGNVLRKLVIFYFRAFHQNFGCEHMVLLRTLAALYVLEPELFEVKAMAGDVETRGELTTGQTVFDRRQPAAWRMNMDVVVDVSSPAAVREALYHRLAELR